MRRRRQTSPLGRHRTRGIPSQRHSGRRSHRRQKVADLARVQTEVKVAPPEPAGRVKGLVDGWPAETLVFVEDGGEGLIGYVVGEQLREEQRVFDGVRGGLVARRHLLGR